MASIPAILFEVLTKPFLASQVIFLAISAVSPSELGTALCEHIWRIQELKEPLLLSEFQEGALYSLY